ncbi:uncharacterized protein Dvir_GJ26355 [Drosophila virilis]|uniref:Uncharacterized protein n=1 Tax=Drosophila virilis TaxID=7244 RepID=A0A0Q9W2Q6_DROVI|nr:uncharacterized protein Dvir_GJ26355 [Drosophila virilis]
MRINLSGRLGEAKTSQKTWRPELTHGRVSEIAQVSGPAQVRKLICIEHVRPSNRYCLKCSRKGVDCSTGCGAPIACAELPPYPQSPQSATHAPLSTMN